MSMAHSTTSARFLDRRTGPHIFTLITLASISAIAMNIFLPSLPSMADHFATTPAVIGLSVGIYLGASALLQIIAGPLSDNVGRRPVMLASLAIFVLASLGCIYAPSAFLFLVARTVQATAAICMVLSRAIVRDMVPGAQASSMIAYVTMGMAVVPMLSPALGGFLDAQFGWQANFWALAFVGALTMVLVWFDQGETAPAAGTSLRAQLRDYPELLTSPRFWGYCLATAFGSGAFFAYLGGGPFVGSEVFGLDPQQLGIYFGAPALGYFTGNFLSGRYSTRFGINTMVVGGLCLTSLGMLASLAVSYAGHGSAISFFGFMCFVGLGNGLTIPNGTAGMLSVRPHLAGTASGLGSAIMIGGGAALSAFAGASLTGESGEIPLLLIMFGSALAGLLCMVYVLHRQRVVARATLQS